MWLFLNVLHVTVQSLIEYYVIKFYVIIFLHLFFGGVLTLSFKQPDSYSPVYMLFTGVLHFYDKSMKII